MSTTHFKGRQNCGCKYDRDIMNRQLDIKLASNNVVPTMHKYPICPMSVYGQYSYDPNSFSASHSSSCSPQPTITSSSSCEFACIQSGKSCHDIKSLAIAAISIDNTNWAHIINKNNALQNKPVARVKVGCFIKECKRSLDNDILPFIPVVIDDKIEYTKVIQIGSKYAGIDFKSYHVSHQLLNGFYGECAEYKLLPRDIFELIMKFCTILEVSRIHLDPDYILDHHQLLPTNKQYGNMLDFVAFTPFISSLVIEYEPEEDSDIELEEGVGLCVQSDWEQ